MDLNETTLHFISEHRTDDVYALALQAHKYPAVDVAAAITQIAGWQQIRHKIPSWAAHHRLLYPPHLPLEQCSSEATARYKALLMGRLSGDRQQLTDLTGGFGIDFSFLAPLFGHADYVERQELLCRLARHNFPLLGLHRADIHCADANEYLPTAAHADWIVVDPARRNHRGDKVAAIADCEPDIAALEPLLLRKATRVMVKLSPMLDLTQALHTLSHVEEAHIVSAGNECKELLLILNADACRPPDEVPIHCINLQSRQPALTFTRRQERDSACPLASSLGNYLYEPNASLLKAGAFRSLCRLYPVEKLHPSSHLYTSEQYLPDFPGRKFRIEGLSAPNRKAGSHLWGPDRKANLTTRNFPIGANELRKRLGLTEGGDRYLFATTLADGQKVLIGCRLPNPA